MFLCHSAFPHKLIFLVEISFLLKYSGKGKLVDLMFVDKKELKISSLTENSIQSIPVLGCCISIAHFSSLGFPRFCFSSEENIVSC